MKADTAAVEKARQKATLETVTDLYRWTDGLFTFTTTKPAGYSFTAGQYARLGVGDDGDIIWRAYSMTSTPSDDYLEFYGIIVPGGLFTTRLKEMKPGDPIWVDRQSFGFMTPDRFTDGEDLWMLSTGTGIGPFISMLRDREVWEKFRRLFLVHCVRRASEFAYQDELSRLQQSPPPPAASGASPAASLQVIQSTTREPATQPGQLHGRITSLLDSGSLEETAGLPITAESSRLMLCGNPAMIEDTRKILHHRGLRPVRRLVPGHFLTENYW